MMPDSAEASRDTVLGSYELQHGLRVSFGSVTKRCPQGLFGTQNRGVSPGNSKEKAWIPVPRGF